MVTKDIPEVLLQDKVLKRVIEQIEPKYFLNHYNSPSTDVYFALLESIVSQQISVKVADVIFGRFLNLFPNQYPKADLLLHLTEPELRSAGLSFQKIKYLKNVAQFSIESDISFEALSKLDDDSIVELLVKIKGVGKWTVEMILIFTLNRPDVFPIDDLAIRQHIIKLYGLEGNEKELRKQILSLAQTWKPHRTLASRYIWKAKDLL